LAASFLVVIALVSLAGVEGYLLLTYYI
jgi:hypothetical protein